MNKLEVNEGPAGVKLYKINAHGAQVEFKIMRQEPVITKWVPKENPVH